MEITLPSDCGNSPRMALVADLAVAWAADDKETLGQWLADDSSWSTFGPSLTEAAISEVVVLGAINHGRAASCDGYLEFADSEQPRVRFSHVFAFSSTTKQPRSKQYARISQSRSRFVTIDLCASWIPRADSYAY